MMSPRVAGRVMVALGVTGIVVGIVGAVTARQLISEVHEGVGRSLRLSAEVLETLDASFALASDTMELLEDGMADAEQAARSLDGSLREGETALETASEITGGELAESLEAVEATLPAVEEAAGAMDRALSTLDALPLGVAYAPERPLDESIGSLRDELSGLPGEMRALGDDTAAAARQLGEAREGTTEVADGLAELETGLTEASDLVEQYEARVGEARTLVAEQRGSLEVRARRAQWGVLLVAFVFVAGQFVPIYLGVALTRGAIDRDSSRV